MIQGSKITLNNKSAVVLHSYNYRDSSLIINFFLSEYGLVSAIAKGVKGKKSKHNLFILLQPFQRLTISLTGKQELLILTSVEFNPLSNQPDFQFDSHSDTDHIDNNHSDINRSALDSNSKVSLQRWELSGKSLYCAYYLNELLLRLLPTHTDCHEIFTLYEKTLEILSHLSTSHISIHYEIPLRLFELKLLEYLGYGLNLNCDVQTDLPIDIHKQYYYILDAGPIEKKPQGIKNLAISGHTLINLANNQFTDQKTLQESKQLLKWALAEHLGDKPLKSREIFKQLYRSNLK